MGERVFWCKSVLRVSAGQNNGGVRGRLCLSSIKGFGVPRRRLLVKVLQLLTYQLTIINDDDKVLTVSHFP